MWRREKRLHPLPSALFLWNEFLDILKILGGVSSFMSGAERYQKSRGEKFRALAHSFFFLVYGIWLLAILVEEFLLRNFTYRDGDPIFGWFMRGCPSFS